MGRLETVFTTHFAIRFEAALRMLRITYNMAKLKLDFHCCDTTDIGKRKVINRPFWLFQYFERRVTLWLFHIFFHSVHSQES